MQRNLIKLADTVHDILVIGGGIYGASVAWEAASRGLSVALVEKDDFGSATSANSLKIIHGGLRYLQNADFKRMRESIRERSNLLKIAPHLIHPLPVLVPTYGHGVKGREAMGIALLLNDLVSFDRNWSAPDSDHLIPSGKVISKSDCLSRVPGIDQVGISGGAFFCDAQVYNSERLTLAFLRSASGMGAQLANYTRAIGFLKNKNQIVGATLRDDLTGNTFEIRAKLIINTSGPWIQNIIDLANESRQISPGSQPRGLAKAANLVVPRLFDDFAVGLQSREKSSDNEATAQRGSRFLFAAPWRDCSMIGTWYFPYQKQHPDNVKLSHDEIRFCLEDFNTAYPTANLSVEDIRYIHCGLLPSSGISKNGDVQLEKHYTIQEHGEEGFAGLMTVSGVKYTTARDVAEKVINRAFQVLKQPNSPSKTGQTALFGGNISNLRALLEEVCQQYEQKASYETLKQLVYHYGTECRRILEAASDKEAANFELDLLEVQTRYAVKEEMAQHLTDVVLRRTGLGTAGKPSDAELKVCADAMAEELGWVAKQYDQELERVHSFYDSRLPQPLLHS